MVYIVASRISDLLAASFQESKNRALPARDPRHTAQVDPEYERSAQLHSGRPKTQTVESREEEEAMLERDAIIEALRGIKDIGGEGDLVTNKRIQDIELLSILEITGSLRKKMNNNRRGI